MPASRCMAMPEPVFFKAKIFFFWNTNQRKNWYLRIPFLGVVSVIVLNAAILISTEGGNPSPGKRAFARSHSLHRSRYKVSDSGFLRKREWCMDSSKIKHEGPLYVIIPVLHYVSHYAYASRSVLKPMKWWLRKQREDQVYLSEIARLARNCCWTAITRFW